MSKQENPQDSILIGLIFTLLGFAFFATHDALVKVLSDYSVFQIIFFAMLFGYVPFSMAGILNSKPISLKPANPKLVILRAIFTVGSLCLAFVGFTMLPMVEVYVLLFCMPLMISVMAIFFLGEHVGLIRWIAILAGLVGVIIVLRPSVDTIQVGHLAALVSAFCGAGASIISRKIGHLENTATLILFPLLANILVAGVALYFVYIPMPLVDLSIMFLLGILGLLGQYFVLMGYRKAPAAYVAPMQYSQLIWAIFFGYAFFGEFIDIYVVIGGAITILSGVAIIWRERSVSKVKANLNTRNTRMVSAAMIKIIEREK